MPDDFCKFIDFIETISFYVDFDSVPFVRYFFVEDLISDSVFTVNIWFDFDLVLFDFIIELFGLRRLDRLLNLLIAYDRSFNWFSWLLFDRFLNLRLLDKLWTQFGLFNLCIAFGLRLFFCFNFNLPFTSWVSFWFLLLYCFFLFLIILRSVPSSSLSLISCSLSGTLSFFIFASVSFSVFILLFPTLLVLFFSFDISGRFYVRMKEKPVPVVHFLLNELDQVFLSSKRSDVKWRSVPNFYFLEIWYQIMIFYLLQKILRFKIDNFDFSSLIKFFAFDFLNQFLVWKEFRFFSSLLNCFSGLGLIFWGLGQRLLWFLRMSFLNLLLFVFDLLFLRRRSTLTDGIPISRHDEMKRFKIQILKLWYK